MKETQLFLNFWAIWKAVSDTSWRWDSTASIANVSIASCMLVIFIICPTICNPGDCSRGVSHIVGFEGGMLCTFAESFQGPYKDGTNNTRYFRMVSISFLIQRISILVLFLNHCRLLTHINTPKCIFCMYFLYLCIYLHRLQGVLLQSWLLQAFQHS